jgi:deoxycytidylate deaminase
MQLLKYISLIQHPGLITPSPEERCMQMAYTAKYNSGCISRQVGATVTDKYFSIKAIGWNNTPEGQVPCLLRNVEALINATDEELTKPWEEQSPDLKAFTHYEKNNPKIKKAITDNFKANIQKNKDILKGRNICMCFKSLHNSCYDGKNQVHTRSLHAEESAFLQIAKYGGGGIMDGKLFTTASPCELCSKKAYQLGIRVIYYIDPYPGISQEQILEVGYKNPDVRLFNGAIGNAYHWLYEPFMPYKEELSLLLNQDIKDLTTIQSEELKELKKNNK